MGESRGHPVVFEAARRVQPFILKQQVPRGHADVLTDLVCFLKEGLSLADRHHHVLGGERQEFSKPPNAREVERIKAFGPFGLEAGETIRDAQAVPVVNDVDQIAANRARKVRLIDGERGAALRAHALLKGGLTGASDRFRGGSKPCHQ